ncbi:nucleotidyl transferase AbiEii/AbiGii toxin family protein [Streptomonospora sp. PA3]|uniref:nucleotidyl transferase AbiEii/AbiGii toxin family protein n=1 Tax=Streptomonospora sp. PA3 TaxID=2607326 RepID=UPI0012DEB37E|nr:nucleotidyl transferase AbiEii/AbiGii toxin family protein [Streptomonospora sp. PA3]MUL42911.1 nucleotidyl transferase AbiEii/AbiGii toxin family protein [Streptomonospora sp. PA3]
MTDTFSSFWRDLNERVREHARTRGTSPQDELRQWVLQRVMVRLFDTQPDAWTVKGGQIQLAHWPDARATGDVDLSATDEVPAAVMAERYNTALEQDYGDHLRFVPGEIDNSIMDTGRAARLLHTAYLGDRPLMEVQTDAALPDRRPRWKPLKNVPFPEHIHASGDARENPTLRMLDPRDVLLHKITGMHMMSRDGAPPFRVQDMVDTLFLADRLHLDGPDMHAILQEEVAYQRAEYGRLRMPEHPGLAYKSLETAVPAAQRFLDPLLGAEAPQADWDPRRGRWVARAGERSGAGAAQRVGADMTALDHPHGAVPGRGSGSRADAVVRPSPRSAANRTDGPTEGLGSAQRRGRRGGSPG